MYGLFWGIRQQWDIDEAKATAGQSVTRAAEAQQRVRELEDSLDRLTLVCMAMWDLIQEKTGLTETDLADRVQELDVRDGVRDGKVTRMPLQCPKCHRSISPRHKRCLYCGQVIGGATAFESL